jgi:predicted Fe-Mo cluster-binding NifX family protein
LSKLADKIKKAMRVGAQPIGFGAAKPEPQPTMVLAATARSAADAAELVKRGADVVLVGAAGAPASVDGVAAAAGVLGAWIGGTREDEAKAFREAGYDFVVFDPDSAAATALLDDQVGYVISVPADLSDTEVRTLEGFNLDAVYVGKIDGALTVRRQMELRRLFSMTRKPLMATVSGSIGAAELQALRDANVAVVVAESPGEVEALRRTIDALPPRARRRDTEDRPAPLVPHAAAADEHDHDDEDM